MKLQRRDILKAALAGGTLGVGGLINLDPAPGGSLGPVTRAPLSPSVAPFGSLDAYEILRNAVRTGRRLNLGGATALAAPGDDSVLITIKVMNHIHTPLAFKLGQITDAAAGTVSYTGSMIPWESKFNNQTTLANLKAKGLDRLTTDARFQALRFNGWFGDMLRTGQIETGAQPAYLSAGDTGAFPAEVAMQAFLGVSQTNLQLNHAIQNCSMMKSTNPAGGDLANHVAITKLIASPLGLVCFNMGTSVETDSGNSTLRVYANDLASIVASGRRVTEYVGVLKQAIGLGLVDDDLATKVNNIAGLDSTLLTELRKSRDDLKNALGTLDTASTVEAAIAANNANTGALQVTGETANQPALAHFLGQVKFVQRALDIPGRPLRNFTLFCHISDIDGGPLDTANPQSKPAEPLSYVEGMRQLAVGLNMLAQVIKNKGNVYVAVVSEGGRAANRGDNKSSFALFMGPGGAGNLKDYLYADMGVINSATDPFGGDPNQGNNNMNGTGQRIPTGNVMVTEAGAPLSDHMNNGAILAGIARHLEVKQAVAATTLAGLGKRVIIQTP
jgi:hypothetical protein